MVNFSGDYLEGANWNQPMWHSNTVAYRHMNHTRANFARRDGNVKNAKWVRDKSPNVEEVFFVDATENHYIGPGWRP